MLSSTQFGILMIKKDLVIKEATMDDAQLYFEWANDPVVRKMAFHTDPIPWENHIKWFSSKVVSEKTQLLLCFCHDQPIGQVRFDILDGGEAEIDISIAKEFRSKGYGKNMLTAAIEYENREYGVEVFVSEVKEENISSQKMFLSSGFQLTRKEDGVCYYQKNL